MHQGPTVTLTGHGMLELREQLILVRLAGIVPIEQVGQQVHVHADGTSTVVTHRPGDDMGATQFCHVFEEGPSHLPKGSDELGC